MTTLATSLTNLPLEGIPRTADSIFLPSRREIDSGSFLDILDRAGASRTRLAASENRVSDSPRQLSDQIDASRASRADNESTTSTRGDLVNGSEREDSSIDAQGTNVGRDEDASSTVDAAEGLAQDSTEDAQDLHGNDAGQIAPGSADGRVPSNEEIIQTDTSGRNLVAQTMQTQTGAIRQSVSMPGTVSLEADGRNEAQQAAVPNGDQRSAASGPVMFAGQTGISVVSAESGETDRIPNGQHATEAVRSNTAIPVQVERAPGNVDSTESMRLEMTQQRVGMAMQTNADAGHSSDGDDGNPGQPNFTSTGATAAESRAMQVETALRLEQATGQTATMELGSRISGTTSSSMQTLGSLTDLTAGLSAMKADQSEASIDGRFTNRIVRGLTAMINQRGGVMTMRLDPPDLGELRIQMSLSRGVVSAQFEASNPQAHELINKHLATLRSSLESQGLTVERLQSQAPPAASSQETTEESADDQSHDGGQGEHESHPHQEDSSAHDETPDEATFTAMNTDVKGARSA